ncbi:MAG: putative porin [Balneolaceae bacterium]|nr:putative porin [Balneolaceae bacterium]
MLVAAGSPAYAQLDSLATDSVAIDTVLNSAPKDTLAGADSTEKVFEVIPWSFNHTLSSNLASSDSTLRWKLVPGWMDKFNREPGVISYRLGALARTNAMQVNAHEARYQELYWEGIRQNDPVSGTVNWDFIPSRKIDKLYSEDTGLSYRSRYYLRQYYLNKPLTQLNFTESKFNYRSLEFMVSQNFSQKTNAEISYWDRRGGGEYNNSEVKGRQIYARVYHQLDNQNFLKLHFLNNKYDISQPFGYSIPDLALFNFDRFTASPLQGSASSNISASTLSLSYYRRPADTVQVNDNFHAGVFLNKRGRDLTSTADTTSYEVQSYGANIHKWMELGRLKLEGSASYELFSNKNIAASSVSRDNWGILRSEVNTQFSPTAILTLDGGIEFTNRSDGYNSYVVDAGVNVSLGDNVSLSVGAANGTKMPTIQQLYWSSTSYQGNPGLDNETVQEAHAKVSVFPIKQLEVGIRGQLKNINNAVMLGTNNSFTNISRYNSVSVTPYFEFNSTHFEFSGSAAYHQFRDDVGSFSQPVPLDVNKRVWLKGSGYIKGYLFDRATYIKAGLAGMIAPFRYKAESYNPVLDFWQPLSNDPFLPVFNRLDVDVSARVRQIIFLLRWENVLDDVAQLGYFETASYPMPPRRFIFGVRVLFRN